MKKRKEAHRGKILQAARELFGRQGYHATTVPQIVARAESSTGSFYFYFRNKEDIFAAVLKGIGERIAASLNDAIATSEDPLDQMRAAVEQTFLFLAQNSEDARIFLRETSGLGGRLEGIRSDIVSSHERSVAEALSALRDRLPPLDPEISSYCWVGSVYEAARRWLEQSPSQRPDAFDIASAVAGFNLRAIGAPGASIPD